MKTFSRIYIKDFFLDTGTAHPVDLKRGTEYVTSEESDGKVWVFTTVWAEVPVNLFFWRSCVHRIDGPSGRKGEEEMTLADWSEEKIKEIKRFADWWNRHKEIHPDNFPEHLEPGDWDEQFLFFNKPNLKWDLKP